MRFLVADDERLALASMLSALDEVAPEAEKISFRRPEELLEYAMDNTYDVAFLDIEMGTMNGLALAKKLKEIRPEGDIVFATGYSQYAIDAFKLRAAGYLMKPVTPEDVKHELDHIAERKAEYETHPGLSARCFGEFEIMYDDKPIKFRYSKTKEVLAYLICRKGAFCQNGEIMAVIWEDKDDTPSLFSNLRNIISDATGVFKELGCGDALIKRRGMIAIDCAKINCDYFRWLAGDIDAVNEYNGDFMLPYEWAEFVMGGFDDYDYDD